MLALYSDDAHVIWPGQGEEAVGRSRIKKLIKSTLKDFPPDGRIVLKSQQAISLGNGYIATIGHWEESFRGRNGRWQTIQLRTSEIIRKKGDRMVYVVDHASVGVPPAPEH
jgi:ketosteroid isomerase-like protein